MRKTAPPSPTLSSGYAAVVEVALQFYLAPQSASESAGAEKRLRTTLNQLLRFAHKFPVARPRALLVIARLLGLRGQMALAAAAKTAGQGSKSGSPFSISTAKTHS